MLDLEKSLILRLRRARKATGKSCLFRTFLIVFGLSIGLYPYYQDGLIQAATANMISWIHRGSADDVSFECVDLMSGRVVPLSTVSISKGVYIDSCEQSPNVKTVLMLNSLQENVKINNYIPIGRVATWYGARFFPGSEPHNLILSKIRQYPACSLVQAEQYNHQSEKTLSGFGHKEADSGAIISDNKCSHLLAKILDSIRMLPVIGSVSDGLPFVNSPKNNARSDVVMIESVDLLEKRNNMLSDIRKGTSKIELFSRRQTALKSRHRGGL